MVVPLRCLSRKPGCPLPDLVILHGNVSVHTLNQTSQWVCRYAWVVMHKSPCSTGLASNDFYPFGRFKKHLAGKRFAKHTDVKLLFLAADTRPLFFNTVKEVLLPR